ncbi:helix-turn-helix domain-containing protein [Streptomyces globisporus]|uniref:helix-turn-helix domain-containing protein n=1 Tax=Streptomyces globisporus TaxID=1908 RepID=UPI0037C6385F
MSEIGRPGKAEAVVLLARGMSADAAGAELGLNGRTVRRWREDPQFEAEIQHARRVLLGEAVAALTPAVRDAVAVLHEALEDRSAAIRIRAASELIRALPLLAEHAALEGRIAALEARQNEMETPSWQAA